jgi:hypothetical protein
MPRRTVVRGDGKTVTDMRHNEQLSAPEGRGQAASVRKAGAVACTTHDQGRQCDRRQVGLDVDRRDRIDERPP